MTETLREDLEAAIAAVEEAPLDAPPPEETPQEAQPSPSEPEEAPPPTDAQPPEETAEETPPTAPSRPRRRDAQGRFLADEHHPDDEQAYPSLTDERVAAPPTGWRPAAREGWEALPESVRREIHRRELDITQGQQQSTDARKLAERFQSTVAPYEHLMAAQGISDPLDGVSGLLKTAAALQMGTPEQKAQRIASLISTYNVDIDALATQLDNPGDSAPNPLEQRIQELEQRIQHQATEQDRANVAEAARRVQEFRGEFFEDVRNDMALLMDLAAQQNRPMTLQQAYDAACTTNPEVQRVLARRQELDQEEAKRKAALASDLSTRQHAPPPQAQANGSIRSALEAAIAQYEEG